MRGASTSLGAAGGGLPPLPFSDEEAIAAAIALRTAESGAVSGVAESALSALSKWRTYRVDRVESRTRTGHRFEVTAPPDAAALVNRGVAVDHYDVRAVVRLSAPLELAQRRVTARVAQLEADGDGFSRMTIGGTTLDWIASYLVGMPFPFEIIEPPELRHLVVQLAQRVLHTNRPT